MGVDLSDENESIKHHCSKDDKSKSISRDKQRSKETEKDRLSGRDRWKEHSNDRDNYYDAGRDKRRKDKERDQKELRKSNREGEKKEKGKERNREKEKQAAIRGKDMPKDRERYNYKLDHDRINGDLARNNRSAKNVVDDSGNKVETKSLKYEQDRFGKSAEEVLSWVSKSRKIEEKRNAEKEKALQFSKIFQERDNMNDGESDDEVATEHACEDLAGVKILHGLDKALEGEAVVLTLKDQSIFVNGEINQEVDTLESVEIGEQKQRNEAYRAAKKKTRLYDDKFNDESGAEKKILPQYDDPITDEGVSLDSSGRFTVEAQKKLEELRKRIQGTSSHGEDLNVTAKKISTDYLTPEEVTKFKKQKKKKSLRKKEKLDIDALEVEAVSAGLGAADLGSRNDRIRRNLNEERDRVDAEMRSKAYQSAYAKAEEACKALGQDPISISKTEEDDTRVFGGDDDELLDMARKIALKKRDEEENFGVQTITNLATFISNGSTGEQQENKVVFTEIEEFVWGLQLDEENQKPHGEDVFMKDADTSEVEESMNGETRAKEEEDELVPDETIRESAIGKGLAATLKLLKDRGMLKETTELGGRNMDKKRSKFVGISENDEIQIERRDEYGRILTPKESFRLHSHKFHGKGPGKRKLEKRMRQYQEELKVKQMSNADTPLLSAERMREAQAKLQTPCLVLSGHVKPGRSDFATVDKDFDFAAMLGDKTEELMLNIKRKAERPGDISPASRKKPRT